MRLLHPNLRLLCALVPLALAAVLTGCATPPQDPKATSQAPPPYVDCLHEGDRIRIELSGIPDHYDPIETDIKDDGSVTALPLIGRVKAAGRSPGQLEEDIRKAYVPKWYSNIGVSVTPLERWVYVSGQVNNMGANGRVRYSGQMTVLSAITAAGDFTPFANKRKVQIIRFDKTVQTEDCVKALRHPEKDLPIYPGDKVYVPHRVI